MTTPAPHRIIFANEKGGTGKSTCAVHFAVALTSLGWRVAGIDLDPRQRTFHRYLENRENTAKRRDIDRSGIRVSYSARLLPTTTPILGVPPRGGVARRFDRRASHQCRPFSFYGAGGLSAMSWTTAARPVW